MLNEVTCRGAVDWSISQNWRYFKGTSRLFDFNKYTPCCGSKPGEVNLSRTRLSMEEAQIKSQVIKADSSLTTTLSRLANVRVQVELIQEDTKRLKQGFSEMAKRINVLTASYHEERDIMLKQRTKA